MISAFALPLRFKARNVLQNRIRRKAKQKPRSRREELDVAAAMWIRRITVALSS